MDYPYFTGSFENRYRTKPLPLPPGIRTTISDEANTQSIDNVDVSGYDVDDALREAVNIAIALGRPLLLTGEPGTGKTELAYVIASELGINSVEKFETKSISTATDLFYHYNTIQRFHAAQIMKKDVDENDYITFNALGKAILHTLPLKDVRKYLPRDEELTKEYAIPRRSVVLIDEVDKAPIDFPNDILNEIDRMEFHIPEFGNVKITANQDLRPVVVLTSNSEKHLPDAFVRRCIYYNIVFPEIDRLRTIIRKQVGAYIDNEQQFIDDLLKFFLLLRSPASGIRKKPATAELLDWIVALKKISRDKPNPIRDNEVKILRSLACLIKCDDDMKTAHSIYENQWKPDQRQ